MHKRVKFLRHSYVAYVQLVLIIVNNICNYYREMKTTNLGRHRLSTFPDDNRRKERKKGKEEGGVWWTRANEIGGKVQWRHGSRPMATGLYGRSQVVCQVRGIVDGSGCLSRPVSAMHNAWEGISAAASAYITNTSPTKFFFSSKQASPSEFEFFGLFPQWRPQCSSCPVLRSAYASSAQQNPK